MNENTCVVVFERKPQSFEEPQLRPTHASPKPSKSKQPLSSGYHK